MHRHRLFDEGEGHRKGGGKGLREGEEKVYCPELNFLEGTHPMGGALEKEGRKMIKGIKSNIFLFMI